ncbi:uncharacterized protein LMH87_008282 [Akanthomyces muscarius]|uniref:Integral membrane protein n=1 Tax=Akanthomyces muscarius TaxID=2231603 RepID=A0A9W8QJ01_AKAMU|nr:uncharacterized protein LMH87_008282 [Akanthomyces muscarius]KAJ4159380.1 hypothetical protein LMH87_008282 [Akanthomyces muscarius]
MAAVSFKSIPPSLRPVVRSYLMGYGATVVPQILSLVSKHVKLLGRARDGSCDERQYQKKSFLRSLVRILMSGLYPQRLPIFCAVLAAGPSFFQAPVYSLLSSSITPLTTITKLRLSRWLSAFISAWAGLWLLQTAQCPSCWEEQPEAVEGNNVTRLAGNTIDITLLTVSRAVDVIVGEAWTRHQASRKARGNWTKAESLISYMADPTIFAVSCSLIMWSWFFHPERLPSRYNKWITSAAQGDERIIYTLRRLYDGSIVYGEKPIDGDATLASVCRDYNLPEEYGDATKTWPFPCVMFHTGHGTTCEERAIRRFIKSWQTAMFTYLPLALVFRLRRRPSKKAILRSFFSASRSSAFLATYITLSYYGVCLARSRIGPLIAGRDIAACRRLDSGIGVGTACALCGWSIFVETKARRKDMALFVAPKALGTLIARRYPVEKEWRERLAFAFSAAVLSTCIRENPKRVRGWLGRLIAYAIRE